MILGLFTGLQNLGGIQRISRHTAAALSSMALDQGTPYRILSLNDPKGRHRFQVGEIEFWAHGFRRNKVRFALASLALMPGSQLAYIGHPNLAPLGIPLRILRRRARYWVATYGIDVWNPLPLLPGTGLRMADGATTLSSYTRDKMTVSQGLNLLKISVVAPALDPAFVDMAEAGAKDGCSAHPSNVILTVARLSASERQKGIDTVIRALPRVIETIPNVRYLIVGDGDDVDRLQSLAQRVGVADHVLFVGPKIGDELAAEYQGSDVFVMPSRKEGFGLVFLEAMAFGKPVIGGHHGGTPEVVRDGVTGFLVEYGDVSVLTDRIVSLLSDQDLRHRMGQAGRRMVEDNYTFEHFRERLARVLSMEDASRSET